MPTDAIFTATLRYLRTLSTVELRNLNRRIFRILKEANEIRDLRNFKAGLFHIVGRNTGASSHLYFDHAALSEFLALVLRRFGKVVNGKYSIAFPV